VLYEGPVAVEMVFRVAQMQRYYENETESSVDW